MLAKVWSWIVLLLTVHRGEVPAQALEATPVETAPTEAVPAEAVPAEAAVAPRQKSKPAIDDTEQFGQFYFKAAVLNQLDMYFHYIKRMKAKDPDAYELYRQVGAHLVPRQTVLFETERPPPDEYGDDKYRVSPWFIATKPAFGAIGYGLYREAEKQGRGLIVDEIPDQTDMEYTRANLRHLPSLITISGVKHHKLGIPKEMVSQKVNWNVGIIWVPKFMYFTKWNKAPMGTEQHSTGTIYKLTIYWDRRDNHDVKFNKKHKGGTPQEYGLWITPNGTIRVLRQLQQNVREVRTKVNKGRDKWNRAPWKLSLDSNDWEYPSKYLTWCEGRENETPLQCLVRIFVEATRLWEQSAMGSMVRIEASKDTNSAVFGVDVKRMAYFFKDRDHILDVSGKKKRIFHIVRPHERLSGSAVKMHFRGLRQFAWNGYSISITVPGKDHHFLPEFDVGAWDGSDPELKREQLAPQAVLGKAWRDHFHGKALVQALGEITGKFKAPRQGRGGKPSAQEDEQRGVA